MSAVITPEWPSRADCTNCHSPAAQCFVGDCCAACPGHRVTETCPGCGALWENGPRGIDVLVRHAETCPIAATWPVSGPPSDTPRPPEVPC